MLLKHRSATGLFRLRLDPGGGLVSQGPGGPGGEWTCLNEFTITANINEKSLRSFQSTSLNNADWISSLELTEIFGWSEPHLAMCPRLGN